MIVCSIVGSNIDSRLKVLPRLNPSTIVFAATEPRLINSAVLKAAENDFLYHIAVV